MNPNRILPSLLFLLACTLPVTAQEPQQSSAEKVADELNATYVAAFEKGDAKALAAMYAEGVQYTRANGEMIVGLAAVQEGLAKNFSGDRGAKLDVRIESARFLTPDVLVEKGFLTIGEESTHYVCNYVKKEGAWLIAEFQETTLPPIDAAAEVMRDLSWMVGSWKDNSPGASVTTEVAWTKNGHFLRRSFTVARDGVESVEGTEIIGYDPAAGLVRSWVFDSEGGLGEGMWKQEENKWLVTARSIAPDGSTSTAQHVITMLDDNKFTWESINRQADGEALPNLEKVEVIRTATETARNPTDR